MNLMLWTALGTSLVAVACFLKGVFTLDWGAAVWMFWSFVFSVVAGVSIFFGLIVRTAT